MWTLKSKLILKISDTPLLLEGNKLHFVQIDIYWQLHFVTCYQYLVNTWATNDVFKCPHV